MTVKEAVYSQALSLPPDERGELAHLLLESLPDDQRPGEMDAEYETELHRRLEEIDSGNAKMLTLEEVMTRLRNNARPSAP